LQEAQAVLTEEEARVACLHYDINEIGEMHHNPAKNVLYQRASVEEIGKRLSLPRERILTLRQSSKEKMYASRLKRPTPYVDKTVYAGWNALCVSAYLEAAKVLRLEAAEHFALRSLDRILAEGWQEGRLLHVLAYSDAKAEPRQIPGVLDDYAFTTVACLDAYEATADISYFNFAGRIANAMVEQFFDPISGGFFDTGKISADEKVLGVLGTRRKPFQDSPTPAGNSVAAIALLRLHAYTNDAGLREKAEQTIELIAGLAGQYGLFAATYGIAAVHLSNPHTQIVVVGSDELAERLYNVAVAPYSVGKAVLKLAANKAVPQNLPPALAETIPQLPAIQQEKTVAIVCSGFTCQPPISDPDELARSLRDLSSESRESSPELPADKKRG
jgi:uncharacterized protein YyaL (SSP411 family)